MRAGAPPVSRARLHLSDSPARGMTTLENTPWICAQIGSREHYAIPRALQAVGRLQLLLTDYWSGGRKLRASRVGGVDAAKAEQRFHPELAGVPVEHLGVRCLWFSLLARVTRRAPWTTIMARNEWFQRAMLARLRGPHGAKLRDAPGVFFGYSYAARHLARFFREAGWKTVLGQIDPGWREEEIVAAEMARQPELGAKWTRAPAAYWQQWREECTLCDRIIVNSDWSRDALVAAGVAASKLTVMPLAFEAPASVPPPKKYPEKFSPDRPLRVLFFGQLVVRKGVHLAVEAARRLADQPIEWHFAGPAEFATPPDTGAARVCWSGPVSRADARRLYEAADVFLLPTLSDGFALTQLEAQAMRVPILASRFCGAVVRDGTNGWLIDPLTADEVAAVVLRCVQHPRQLAGLSAASRVGEEFSLRALQTRLLAMERELFSR